MEFFLANGKSSKIESVGGDTGPASMKSPTARPTKLHDSRSRRVVREGLQPKWKRTRIYWSSLCMLVPGFVSWALGSLLPPYPTPCYVSPYLPLYASHSAHTLASRLNYLFAFLFSASLPLSPFSFGVRDTRGLQRRDRARRTSAQNVLFGQKAVFIDGVHLYWWNDYCYYFVGILPIHIRIILNKYASSLRFIMCYIVDVDGFA